MMIANAIIKNSCSSGTRNSKYSVRGVLEGDLLTPSPFFATDITVYLARTLGSRFSRCKKPGEPLTAPSHGTGRDRNRLPPRLRLYRLFSGAELKFSGPLAPPLVDRWRPGYRCWRRDQRGIQTSACAPHLELNNRAHVQSSEYYSAKLIPTNLYAQDFD